MRVKLYICIFCICLGVLGCGQRETSELINGTDVVPPVTIEAIPQPTPSPTPVPTPVPTPEPPKEIQLMMVGDNLMHMGIVRTGEQADGSYNYDILFEGIQPFLEQAEIKMINQETILGGNEKGFSGYPYFSPSLIKKRGISIVSIRGVEMKTSVSIWIFAEERITGTRA